MVPNVPLLAERLHERPGLAQVVPGKPRVEVVLDLELEPAVEEVEPPAARNVHRGAALHLEPLVGRVVVSVPVVGAHGEVRDANLHVQQPGTAVADDCVEESLVARQRVENVRQSFAERRQKIENKVSIVVGSYIFLVFIKARSLPSLAHSPVKNIAIDTASNFWKFLACHPSCCLQL